MLAKASLGHWGLTPNCLEIVRKYRQFVYETGAVDAGKGKVMDNDDTAT
jgi:hypothetical protein